ncbi:cation diffusion facilitator family transporter [Fulvivirga maritima]|uniref:cation diffusion facilitator family transporter n=1 Tax=Fulvivirga maritima TaxID=2904247 RepID=UPI001F474D30|nr:cation diffusion facilitator family transporter [Fulvivirga maritima]UII25035.1 cation diffusion facilitator family transporter [Fulvivirga maritima]
MAKRDHQGELKNKKALKTTLIGIIISAFLAIIKALGGILGNSYALIADAIESATDVFTSAMMWVGLKWSAKPPDENHPYGHGKAEALISVGIGIALTFAAYLIVKDSIHHIIEPHKTPAPYTLVILIVVIITKELLYRFVLKTGDEIESGAVKADAFHHRSDAITSAAAFIGISIAIIGGKGYEKADDLAALFAAVFILINVYHIIRPAIGELLDESMDPELNEKIINITEGVQGVIKVEKCNLRKMGLMYHVDLHIWVNSTISVEDGHRIAHDVKDTVQHDLPQVLETMIHVEPAKENGLPLTIKT